MRPIPRIEMSAPSWPRSAPQPCVKRFAQRIQAIDDTIGSCSCFAVVLWNRVAEAAVPKTRGSVVTADGVQQIQDASVNLIVRQLAVMTNAKPGSLVIFVRSEKLPPDLNRDYAFDCDHNFLRDKPGYCAASRSTLTFSHNVSSSLSRITSMVVPANESFEG